MLLYSVFAAAFLFIATVSAMEGAPQPLRELTLSEAKDVLAAMNDSDWEQSLAVVLGGKRSCEAPMPLILEIINANDPVKVDAFLQYLALTVDNQQNILNLIFDSRLLDFSEDALKVLVRALDSSMISMKLKFPPGFDFVIKKRGDRFLEVLIGSPLCKHLIGENLAGRGGPFPTLAHVLDSPKAIELLGKAGSLDTSYFGSSPLRNALFKLSDSAENCEVYSDKIAALLIAGVDLYRKFFNGVFVESVYNSCKTDAVWYFLVEIDAEIKAARQELVEAHMKLPEEYVTLINGLKDEGSGLFEFPMDIMQHIAHYGILLARRKKAQIREEQIYETCRGLCQLFPPPSV